MSASPACKTLLIHIGDHKTGTTSVQYAFAQNKVSIPEGQIHYPAQMSHNYLLGHTKAWNARATGKRRAAARASFDQLSSRIRKSGAAYALLSGESLEGVDPAKLRQIIDTHFRDTAQRVRIIAYVRPHAARLLSSYATQTKSGLFVDDMLAFHRDQLNRERLYYTPRFSAWRAAFEDDFVLRPFVRTQLYRQDVLQDLVHHGFDLPGAQVGPVEAANESLDLSDLMRLKFLQSHPLMRSAKQKLRHALGWLSCIWYAAMR